MTQYLKVALIQINSGADKASNLRRVSNFINEAARHEAKLIALPEVFNFRSKDHGQNPQSSEILNESESLETVSNLARIHQIYILAGSIMIKPSQGLPFNTSLLINPQGKIIAEYQKIHLFDIQYGEQKILESSRNQAGYKPVIARIPIDNEEIKIGLSICYDLRFPELYRIYAKEKVEIITVPSAFTQVTGEAHWHTLVKARAIENQCFVLAPNQCGDGGQVQTYGHSLIVDPWGNILAEASGEREEIIYAELDFSKLKDIRSKLPSLEHRKL